MKGDVDVVAMRALPKKPQEKIAQKRPMRVQNVKSFFLLNF
jgi:hypothetical protein